MKLPAKIEPCPILESVIEVRFSSNEISEAIFGLFQREIKETLPNYERLGILDLPEVIRKQEPNLKYKPHFKFTSDEYDVNLGPNVITVIKKNPYNGWEDYSQFAIDIFSKLKSINIVDKVERLGIRYINFFESDIYKNVDIELTLSKKNWFSNNTYIKNEFAKDGHTIILQLSNSSNIKNSKLTRAGSLLDIDVINHDLNNDFLDNPRRFLDTAHLIEKEVFFRMLKDDFIETLNPEYT